MRVFVTHNSEDLEAYYGRALERLLQLPVDVVTNSLDRDLSTRELIQAAAGCQVIVAHRSTPGEASLFGESSSLFAFLRTAVDISTVDVAAASESGVVVARADKSFVASTAELALGLLLDVARNIAASSVDYRAGEQPPQRAGFQLSGKTAGIIGFGAIGEHLAQLLRSLGLAVVVNDPYRDVGPVEAAGCEPVPIDELLSCSDVVFPLAASTAETENLIDAAALAKMKSGSVLINVSRGELVDDDALIVALDSGHLRGAGLDVGRAPDQRPSTAVAARPDVVATPHLGGLTPENADAQAQSSVDQIAAMLDGTMPERTVNPDHAARLESWWASR